MNNEQGNTQNQQTNPGQDRPDVVSTPVVEVQANPNYQSGPSGPNYKPGMNYQAGPNYQGFESKSPQPSTGAYIALGLAIGSLVLIVIPGLVWARLLMAVSGLILSIVENKQQRTSVGSAAFTISLISLLIGVIFFLACLSCLACAITSISNY